MKSFTVSEFRGDVKAVWSEVEKNGIAKVKHRDREDMVVIQKSEWEMMVKDRDYYKDLVKGMAEGEY